MNSVSARRILPREVWLVVAECLSIRDLGRLSCTDHTMHGLIANSRSVWQGVIEDLLTLTPNATIARSLPSCAVEDLQQLAIRYRRVAQNLSLDASPDLARFVAFPCPMVGGKLVPGTPFMLMMASNGHIHLESVVTGESVDVWSCGEDLEVTEANFGISADRSLNGPTFEICAFTKNRTADEGILMIFLSIEPTSPPRILPMCVSFSNEMHGAGVSAYGRKFAFISKYQDGAMQTVSIANMPSSDLVHSSVTQLVTHTLNLPVHLQGDETSQLFLLSPDLACLFNDEGLHVVQLPLHEESIHDEVPDVKPLRSFAINSEKRTLWLGLPSLVQTPLGAQYDFPFIANGLLRMAHISDRPDLCSINSFGFFQNAHESFNMQGIRICAASLMFDSLHLRYTRIPNSARHTTLEDSLLALQPCSMKQFITQGIPKNADLLDVEFDEWTGLTAVVWQIPDQAADGVHVTVLCLDDELKF